jgi:hypothetical protein
MTAFGDTVKTEPVLYCPLLKDHCGMVVMRAGETGYFQRFGIFQIDSDFEFEDKEREFKIR